VSDYSQGPGWWQASDGKWYSPEQAPGYQTPPPGAPFGAPSGGPTGGPYGTAPDLGTALSYGWNKFIANIGDILIIWLVVFGVQLGFNLLQRLVGGGFLVSTTLTIIGFVISMILQIALIRVGLLITSGQKPTVEAAFSTDNLGPYIVASLLFGLALFIGLLVFCIGALIAGFLLWFYGYFVIDRNEDPVTSLKSSYELVTKNLGVVGPFALIAIVLSFCTLGLAAPILQISSAYIYRSLNGQPVAP
jgi:hypothetical protein